MLSFAQSAQCWLKISEYTARNFYKTVMSSTLPKEQRLKYLHELLQDWGLYALSVMDVKVTIKGAGNIISPGPQIFFVNHQSSLDIFLVASSIPVPFSWLYKKELEWIPLVGQFLKWFGSIGINRRNLDSAKKSLARAARLVSEGQNLVVFPEGTRSHNQKLLPFKKGVFHLAIESQVPIIPVTLNGSWRVLGKNPFNINPGPTSVIFHPMVETKGYSKDNLPKLMEKVRQSIESGLED